MIRILAAALCAGLAVTSASAAVVVEGRQVGLDYIFTYEGSVDLTRASPVGGSNGLHQYVRSGFSELMSTNGAYDFYSFETGMPTFGDGFFSAGVRDGDQFGFSAIYVYLASDYQSGTPISGTLTFANADAGDLQLTAGSYQASLANGDTVTLNIAADVPAPAAAPLLLAGIGAVSAFARRRKG